MYVKDMEPGTIYSWGRDKTGNDRLWVISDEEEYSAICLTDGYVIGVEENMVGTVVKEAGDPCRVVVRAPKSGTVVVDGGEGKVK
ncbi:hypothetical protein [Telmatospirillum sp.]|uniref:hypothetical protein n=1 Tax=Telmatospirillum sp. TaxID=2079197 RepID=UPI00283C2C75|nr:hypothetical protein [Telmatospirillum sp.]MDR3435059.1 hypothetical protein [Telmatospirillum sp.]